MKFIYITTIILFIWSLPTFYFLNSTSFYLNQFEVYQIYDNFENSREEVNEKYSEVLDYINLRTDSIDNEFFSYEDQIHLKDVQELVRIFYAIFLIIVSILIFMNKKVLTLNNIERSANINLIFSGIIISISVLNFTELFILFHKLLFSNEYWMLDPTSSNLIKYFPEEIFQNIAILILLFVIITSIISKLVLWRLQKKRYLSQADI